MSYLAVPPGSRPAVGTTTDSIGAGGVADTISTFTGALYATDAPAILGDLHQLAARILILENALKTLGLVVT